MKFFNEKDVQYSMDQIAENPIYQSVEPSECCYKLRKIPAALAKRFQKHHLKAYLNLHPEFVMSADQVEDLLNTVNDPHYLQERQRENMVDAAVNLVSDLEAMTNNALTEPNSTPKTIYVRSKEYYEEKQEILERYRSAFEDVAKLPKEKRGAEFKKMLSFYEQEVRSVDEQYQRMKIKPFKSFDQRERENEK